MKKQEAEQYLRNENILAMRKNQLYQMHVFECNGNIEIASKAVVRVHAGFGEEGMRKESMSRCLFTCIVADKIFNRLLFMSHFPPSFC